MTQNDIAVLVSIIVGLVTLVSVVFGAGMQWGVLKGVKKDVDELKQRRQSDYGFIEEVRRDIAVIKKELEKK